MSKISKLGVGIVAFEGTEHIKNITHEIRPYVDEIVVCLQDVSYTGISIDKYDIEEVERCVAAGLVDKIVWYSFTHDDVTNAKNNVKNDIDWPRYLECEKRNKLLGILEDDNCSHALIMDSDEYYDGREFSHVKNYIDNEPDTHVTYVQYVNYWKDYRHYIAWSFKTYVPFITEIGYRFSFGAKHLRHNTDKTRIYGMKENDKYSVINWKSIKMHHLSWIRLDIEKKIRSWSSLKYFNQKEVDFVIEKYKTWKPYENAYVTFMSPLRPMCVVDLKRQYIHPKYMLSEKI